MRDILSFLVWWLIVSCAGLVAWPLLFRMLPQLPDRGYAVSKTCGLLLLGYVFWMFGSLGFLHLTFGGVIVAALSVAAATVRWGQPRAALEWLRAHYSLALVTEAVFLIGFGIWTYVRALNPEIVGTEKPMEFAFLNSILRSGVMPPRDPWLSGYAISYYYFGYVIIAILACLSGTSPGVAFNLGVALLFGLTAVGAFGVAFNLIAVSGQVTRRVSRVAVPALLAPVFTVVTGNLNGVLEVLHQRGLGAARFWQWLGIKWLDFAPTPGGGWLPQRYLWWWQASRVIRDRDLTGAPIGLQPIDEFPFFSFLLGDLHPHVLALPFVFLALAVALQLFLTSAGRPPSAANWLPFPVSKLLFFALVLGGLSFLNTWDFPIYLFVAVAAYAVGRRVVGARELRLGLILAVMGVILYLPFYIGFRSQAGGILPNPVFSTRVNQFCVLFGVLLLPALGWLSWESTRAGKRLNWRLGMLTGPAMLAGLTVTCGVLTTIILMTPRLREMGSFSWLMASFSTDEVLGIILRRRLLEEPWTALLLTAALLLVGGLLPRKMDALPVGAAATPFVALLFGVGALLTLGPEFLYLRDSFGTRMNTIFKFYYQAWALWSVVAAFGFWRVRRSAGKLWRSVFGMAVTLTLAAGLLYPGLSIWAKTVGLQGATLAAGERDATLDGTAALAHSRPEDYAAINWLNHFLPAHGVIAEAVGGSYTEYGRVAVHSGLPTVLGWPGHELQWRGGFEPAAGREDAVHTLFSTRAWDEAAALLARYDIRYVYVGSLERQQFPAQGLQKFENHMRAIYRNSGVTIYERFE